MRTCDLRHFILRTNVSQHFPSPNFPKSFTNFSGTIQTLILWPATPPQDFPALVVAVAPGGEDDSGKGQMHKLEQTSEGRNLTKVRLVANARFCTGAELGPGDILCAITSK
jgi:hypothetical protein